MVTMKMMMRSDGKVLSKMAIIIPVTDPLLYPRDFDDGVRLLLTLKRRRESQETRKLRQNRLRKRDRRDEERQEQEKIE